MSAAFIRVVTVTPAELSLCGREFTLMSAHTPVGANRTHFIDGGMVRAESPGLCWEGGARCLCIPICHRLPSSPPVRSWDPWPSHSLHLIISIGRRFFNPGIQDTTSSDFSGLFIAALYFWICRHVRMARYQWQEVWNWKIIPGVRVILNTAKALLSPSLNRMGEQLIPWVNEIYFWCEGNPGAKDGPQPSH